MSPEEMEDLKAHHAQMEQRFGKNQHIPQNPIRTWYLRKWSQWENPNPDKKPLPGLEHLPNPNPTPKIYCPDEDIGFCRKRWDALWARIIQVDVNEDPELKGSPLTN